MEIKGKINEKRRKILMKSHSAAHIISAVCRQILGKHVWQQGAKKSENSCHIDISHYKSLTNEEEFLIEQKANEIISKSLPILCENLDRTTAEQKFGFQIYQGGAVPGSSLRIINMPELDWEACCGTHCENTSEINLIKILGSHRISDGVIRINFLAGEQAFSEYQNETKILRNVSEIWGIDKKMIIKTADRFLKDYKKYNTECKNLDKQVLDYQIKLLEKDGIKNLHVIITEKNEPTLYFSNLAKYAENLQKLQKGIIFVGENFVIGLLGNKQILDVKWVKEFIGKNNENIKTFKIKEKISVEVFLCSLNMQKNRVRKRKRK